MENSSDSGASIYSKSENPRSQPDMRFPYMENQRLFNNINNKKNNEPPIQAKRQAAEGGDRNRAVEASREEGNRPDNQPRPAAQANPDGGRGADAPLAGRSRALRRGLAIPTDFTASRTKISPCRPSQRLRGTALNGGGGQCRRWRRAPPLPTSREVLDERNLLPPRNQVFTRRPPENGRFELL